MHEFLKHSIRKVFKNPSVLLSSSVQFVWAETEKVCPLGRMEL